MTLHEQCTIIGAAIDKLPLQARRKPDFAWSDMVEGFTEFDFAHYDYRVRPEPPKPREWWLVTLPNGKPISVFTTYEAADLFIAGRLSPHAIVHVREVLS